MKPHQERTGPVVVLYHGACRDGWCAAWAATHVYPDAELIAVYYGQAIEPGSDLILADFSYPRETLLELAEVASRLRIYDHHATAQVALADVEAEAKHRGLSVRVYFDLRRSGAGIVWDELVADGHPGLGACVECHGHLHGWPVHDPGCPSRAPWPVRYVEDRDLWRWALPMSREVNAYLGTLPYTGPPHHVGPNLAAWSEASRTSLALAIDRGSTAQLALRAYVEAVAANAVMRVVGGRNVPSVNAPQHEISELLEHLLDRYPGAPYVHGWWQRADGRLQHSLRAREVDVSEVARRFGGGGHKLAAGFETGPEAHHVADAFPLEAGEFKAPGPHA